MQYQEGVIVARRIIPVLACAVAVSGVLLLAACGSDGSSAEGGGPRVAASTALIAEFASVVAGDDAEVTTLIPGGVDVHSFEPAPATVGAIAEADIVFVNGYNLEEGLLPIVIENVADGVAIVPVAAGLAPLEGGHEHEDGDDHEGEDDHVDTGGDLIRATGDPHFWLDVSNAIHYVEQIRDHLVELDPSSADGYRARSAAYILELEALDAEVGETIGSIPVESRKLVVLHDAYQYLAHAYGLQIAAALLPVGAQQDSSASEVAALIKLIEQLGVPVIYREPQFSAAVLDSIAEETGVRVMVLYSTYAEGIDSYEALMRANAAALVEGLGS
jgi:manganese/iron transport system substrate-binding protein